MRVRRRYWITLGTLALTCLGQTACGEPNYDEKGREILGRHQKEIKKYVNLLKLKLKPLRDQEKAILEGNESAEIAAKTILKFVEPQINDLHRSLVQGKLLPELEQAGIPKLEQDRIWREYLQSQGLNNS